MSEFAFSGVGINPHHGTPANAATAALDPTPRIPGGSTSGGAVVGGQRRGLGRARLGHRRLDPHPGGAAGPGRLQEHRAAGADRRRHPAVDHAGHRLRHHPLGARRRRCCTRCWPSAAWRWHGGRCRALRLAVPTTLMLDGAGADRRARLRARAGDAARAPARTIDEIAAARRSTSWPAINATRRLLGRRELGLAPPAAGQRRRAATTRAWRCASAAARRMSAADYIDLLQARARLDRAHGGARMRRFDALLSPTVPIVAPPIAPLLAERRGLLRHQRAAAAQPVGRQPARRLRPLAALPSRRRDAGRPDGVERARCATTRCSTSSLAIEARARRRGGAEHARRRHRRRHRRRDHRLRARRRRPRGHRVRAPRQRRRRDQLRQRRRRRAGLRHALGRARACRARCCASVQPPCAGAPAARRWTRPRCGWMWRWWRACRADDLAGQPHAHAAPGACSAASGCTSSTHALQLDYERGDGLPRAAAQRAATWRARAARPGAADRAGRALPPARRRALPPDRARPERRTRRCTPASTCPTTRSATAASSRTCCATRRSGCGARFRFHTHGAAHRARARAPRVVHRYAPPAESTQLLHRAGTRPATAAAAPSRCRSSPITEELRRRRRLRGARRARAAAPARPAAAAARRCYGYSVTAPLRQHDGHPDLGPRAA